MPTKILAIDDSKTMRLAIKITFAAEDADVTAVSKGSEAIARAKQLGADIVLVDANLAAGEPSGYDVCEQLRADPDTARIPVLILVSNQGGVDAARLKRCGAEGFIAKPFETQELIDKVAEAIGKGGSTSPGAAAPSPSPVAAPAPAAPIAAAQSVAAPHSVAAPQPVAPPPAFAAPQPTATSQPFAAPQATPRPPVASPPVAKTLPVGGAPGPVAARAAVAPIASPQSQAAPAPTTARNLQPIARPADQGDAEPPIPIAIPIPFAPAGDPTPGMLARLRAQGGSAAAGLDPKVAEAIIALSREVLEAVAWEVVPELAEQIVRARAEAKVG